MLITLDQLIRKLHARLKTCNQRQLAADLGISQAFLSDVLHKRKEPGPVMLLKLGLRREVRYRRVVA